MHSALPVSVPIPKQNVLSMQLKKVLSSIPEAPMNVECLMNDIDFRSSMTREQFEELAKPVLERARAPLEKVCQQP